MNWINPRDKLPEVGDLIWVLIVNNNDANSPSAECKMAIVITEFLNIIKANELNKYGQQSGYDYFFFNWSAATFIDSSEDKSCSWEMITAWCPYSDIPIPSWEYLSMEESKAIITSSDDWVSRVKEYKEVTFVKEYLERARKYEQFIDVSDCLPFDGVYIAANKGGVWLLKYEKDTCNPWTGPNGLPVEAWYPIPRSY